ncbi:energy transducer TonB [Methylocystis parvus]|uniref:energy transducer TonB n=1 Tax=Methylocystis parvus TaxID=134 RepID=UPI003C74958C
MSDLVFARATEQAEPGRARPPLRPSWLHRTSAVVVIAAHAIFFAAFLRWMEPQLISLASIDAELVRDGDFLEMGAPAGVDEAQSEEDSAEIDPAEFAALPPPPVMEPVEVPVEAPKPVKKERAKKNPDKAKRETKNAVSASSASRGPGGGIAGPRSGSGSGRGPGVPGGRGTGAGASEATCLAGVAVSIRRHLPGATSLGPGSAFVTFHINSGGGISGVSASGSTPAHAALARRIVASARGPALCGAAFASQNISFE